MRAGAWAYGLRVVNGHAAWARACLRAGQVRGPVGAPLLRLSGAGPTLGCHKVGPPLGPTRCILACSSVGRRHYLVTAGRASLHSRWPLAVHKARRSAASARTYTSNVLRSHRGQQSLR
eukprot:scaffold3791_cov390-Prasinococcus_capsulatus_cf.AAC.12